MDEKRITKLAVQKKNPGRVNVYLDEEFAFGLNKECAVKLSLGQLLSEEQIESLLADDKDESAYKRALSLLSIRPRSENEIRKKLQENETDETTVEKTVRRLNEAQLLNDQKFCGLWVDNRNSFHPRSRRMLAYELRQKGIAEDVIQKTLQNSDDNQTAFALAERYQRKLADADWQTFRRKLGSYLTGKGYDYDTVRQVTQEVWKSTHEQSEE